MQYQEKKGLGPFAVAGKLFSTIGTVAKVVDQTVITAGNTLNEGLLTVDGVVVAGREALTIVTKGALDDLKATAIVDDAQRHVQVTLAKAEAARIIASITPSVTDVKQETQEVA